MDEQTKAINELKQVLLSKTLTENLSTAIFAAVREELSVLKSSEDNAFGLRCAELSLGQIAKALKEEREKRYPEEQFEFLENLERKMNEFKG